MAIVTKSLTPSQEITSFIDGPSSAMPVENAVQCLSRISQWVSCKISIKFHMKYTPTLITDSKEC